MITVRVRALDLARFSHDMDKASRDVRKPGKAARDGAKDFDQLLGKFDVLAKIQKAVKPAAIVAGIGAVTGAVSSLAAGAVALGGALAPVSGALVAYPALGLAGAQGLGVFKLATTDVFKAVGGLNQQLDKNSTAFKKLSPEAQRFAVQLQKLKQPFQALPAIAQKAMMPGFTAGLKAAAKNLGILKPLVKATGAALGGFAKSVGELLGGKGFGRDLQTIGMRNVRWMSELGGGALHLVDALRHILIAAGPLVGWLVKTAVGWARSADAAARSGRETGRLQAFFERTRQTLARVFSIAGAVATSLFNIGKAGAPLGNTLLRIIDRNAKAMAAWTGSARGQNAIARFFAQAKAPLLEAGRLVAAIARDFAMLGSGSQGGLAPLLRIIRTELLPVLVQVVNSTTKAFGPVFVKTLADLAKAFAPMLGSSGPLVLFVKTLDLFAKASLALEHTIPGSSAALSLLAGSLVVLRTAGMAKFVSELFGARKGLTAFSDGLKAIKSGLDTAKLGMETMRLAFVAQGGAANASNLAVLRAAAAAKLQAFWSKIAAGATKVWAAAQWLLNVAMDANPVTLVIIAIAALIAIIVVIALKVKAFRHAFVTAFHWVVNAARTAWGWIKGHWPLLLAILIGPFALVVYAVKRHFGTIVGFIKGMPGRIARAAKGMWDGIVVAFKAVLNKVIGLWDWLHDKLHIHVGARHIGPVKIPGVDMHLIPFIPPLKKGGDIARGGAAMVGDAGPEILDLPAGASVHPLGRGSGDDLAEKIAAAIARRTPKRAIDIHLFGDRVGRGVLRYLEDQAVSLG